MSDFDFMDSYDIAEIDDVSVDEEFGDFFGLSSDLDEEISFETEVEEFANEMENITQEDIVETYSDLQQLANLSDDEIYEMYNSAQETIEQQEIFDSLTADMTKDELIDLQERVMSGDKEITEIFYPESDVEESGRQKIIK